jgi:hypothetical protein
MPAGKPVPPADLETFQSRAAPLLAHLERLSAQPLALRD